MIIVQLMGGVGNQLFQYAFGKNLAVQNNCDLKLDLSFFENQSIRSYELSHFRVVESFASAEECMYLKKTHDSRFNRYKRKFFGSKPNIIEERDLSFDASYLRTESNTYLTGYWQSERYFNNIKTIIKNEFEIKTSPSKANHRFIQEINSTPGAVSVHIRRGDFNNDIVVNKIHGTCSLNYYDKAVQAIVSSVSEPIFFVFSDDTAWAKKNLNLNLPTHFVDINDERSAYEDMRLMQNCKHHIIANSTFSWWGAWLGLNKDKIVIAPKKWFNDPTLNVQSESIIPPTWIRI